MYEIMWKNTVEPDRPRMIIQRMSTERWMTQATEHTRIMQYLRLLHCNDGCTNALQRYVIRTLPVLFNLNLDLTTIILFMVFITS